MEFIKIARQKSFFSSLIYILLNILLTLSIWLSIDITGSPLVAFLLVLISKWRVFAVRPRFWLANVKSNLVDLIVCLGLTTLIWLASGFTALQVGFVFLYVIWLVVVKPKSSIFFVHTQALTSVFFGLFALLSIGHNFPLFVVVACSFVIGYSSLRHILSTKKTHNLELISSCWGLIVAELAWLFSHWLIGYSLVGSNQLLVPQAAIITTVLSFLLFSIYRANEDGKIKIQEIILPLIFSIAVCFILIIFFSMSPEI